MGPQAWISGIFQNYLLGDKLGMRAKYSGESWEPAQFESPVPSEGRLQNIDKYLRGTALERNDFPEAISVWNNDAFATAKDVFFAGGFLAVKGVIADQLKDFDFGQGGLVPCDIVGSDLKTPIGLEAYFLNLGARKNTFLPEKSTGMRPYSIDTINNSQIWKARSDVKDGQLVLSEGALSGADIWVETEIASKIFLSQEFGEALMCTSVADEFRLVVCKIDGAS
jgi:hypothetical protein